ncbi:hypothetical protein SLE2022_064370 [Rubroshorea leprosula]
MGWVWRDEPDDEADAAVVAKSTIRDGERCSTRKMVRSQCKTEEVEPGKFVRKCEKTEEILRDCIGRPTEVVKSNTEYTEEDVTEAVLKGRFPLESHGEAPFSFPGLRNDIESIERHVFGGIKSLFDAAEEMRKSFFDGFEELHGRERSSSPSIRRRVPIEGRPEIKSSPKPEEPGNIDLSGLARDV